MKITKDEARILAAALGDGKFIILKDSYLNREENKRCFDALEKLEAKLDLFGKDSRRLGRTSQNTLTDTFKRYEKKIRKEDESQQNQKTNH